MTQLRQQQLDEAARRMRTLDINTFAIDDIRRGRIWYSKPVDIFGKTAGSASPLVHNEAIEAAVAWVMDVIDCDALIYHIVTDGSTIHVLFVGADPLGWSYERPIRQDGDDADYHVLAAVYNVLDPTLSCIRIDAISSRAGGLFPTL